MKTLPKLLNDDGLLAAGDTLLIYYYPSGDVDTIAWPRPNPQHLRSALYDAREQGIIPNVPAVILPSGKEFLIDA
jgi:hypothetical protein